ncbi:hypothetical protein F9L33_14935 [Amylibacter sp. SFDW26]|uniref:GspMb/PilO family protein n=1 Tax=Amylibacter sp. SFDW26 TaxID=2652722 RepID=UPI00126242F9|nr:GspMb/PilO family protein [Amylibacter sp. SFDW26]KAB7610186.1 hypothetical protein F9L33_14935 [Amylibacter sp. SFDW26]
MTRSLYIFAPLFTVICIIWTAGYLPLKSAINHELKYHDSLILKREDIAKRLRALPQGEPSTKTPYIWGDGPKDLGQAVLNLQSAVSEIASQHQIPELLLGPNGTANDGNVTKFLVDFETETSLRQAVAMLAQLEQYDPPIGVQSLDIRHISTFNQNTTDVNVYMRLTLWGWVSQNEE